MVKVGFIGCGGIAKTHLSILKGFDDVSIGAVCDIDRSKAEEIAEEYRCRSYTDFKKMLEKEKLDAVYICIPPSAHGEIEINCVKKGIAMFIEKPIAVDLQQAKKMLRVIRNSKVIVSVGYVFRYNDAIESAKLSIRGKKIGLVKGNYLGGFIGTPWWRKMKISGGQLIEQTTHVVDLSRYFVGDVDFVYGYAFSGLHKNIPNYDIHDASIMLMKFSNGTIGEISSCCLLSNTGTGEVSLKLIGRDLEIRTGGFISNVKVYRGDSIIEFKRTKEPFFEENRVFIDAVKRKSSSKIKSDYLDAYKTFLVTYAATKSFLTGRVIDLRKL